MLDLASIMFSSIMMLFILLRARKLDAELPWFPPVRQTVAQQEPKPGQWRRNHA